MSEICMLPINGNNLTNSSTMQSLSNNTLEMLQNKMLQTILPVLYLLIFFFSVPLNSLSVWILCQSQPRTPTIVFLLNLAVTDLMYGITLPFQAIYHLRGNDWPFGDSFCTLTTILFYGNMNCSILTMASISVERYMGIVHPLRCKSFMTIRKVIFTCLFIWLFVLLVDLPLMYSKLTYNVQRLGIITCFDILPKDMFSDQMYFYFYFACRLVLFFFIPLIVMGISYISIIITLLQSHTIQSKTKKQTVHIIVVLLVVFMVCYLPNNLIQIFHFQGRKLYVEYKLSLALNSLNCCLDSVVYFFGSKEYRQKVKHRINHCIHKNNLNGNTDMVTKEYDVPIASC
ncbi:P2Y purinoceptor 8-like [Rhinophrynus dorsalis]